MADEAPPSPEPKPEAPPESHHHVEPPREPKSDLQLPPPSKTDIVGRVSKKGQFYDKRKRTNSMGVQVEDIRICVIMVGLPARGKSLIAQKGTVSREHARLTALWGR